MFDLVTLLEVIEHIRNKKHVLSEAFRVLKEKGPGSDRACLRIFSLASREASDRHPFFSDLVFCMAWIITGFPCSGQEVSLSAVLPIPDHMTFPSCTLGDHVHGSRIGKRGRFWALLPQNRIRYPRA